MNTNLSLFRFLMLSIIILTHFSCGEDIELKSELLSEYLEANGNLEQDDLIACAAGKLGGLSGNETKPTAIFFYPLIGATDFKYFEAENIADSLDYSKYLSKDLSTQAVFNGYLRKFENEAFDGERMGIVSFKTEGKIHICNPIRLKTNIKPTEVNPELGTIIQNGTEPSFSWEDGLINENIIYFQVISDENGDLISGTYTYQKEFSFYNLSNVVLNISDTIITPSLEPNKNYIFTMMGVSDDNWVNLLIEKEFRTD